MTSNVVKKRGRPSKSDDKRSDYWENIFTNMGTPNGRVSSTKYNPSLRLDRQTLTDIYTSDGIGRRIVNIMVDDALRGFIEADRNLIKELQRIKFKQKVVDCASWARLYGGGILVAFIDDGQEMDKPLNLKTVRKVVSIRAYDRFQVFWDIGDLSVNYYEEHYGEPDIFSITPISAAPFKVHRSRCHIFSGERIPDMEKMRNSYWDNSVLQAVYEALRNYGSTMNASAEIIQDFIQTILSVNGLTNMLAQGNDNLITQRLNVLDVSRSVYNTVILDSEKEVYQKHSSSVAGLAELWDRFSEAICATTGIPSTKLFGRSPSGLNSVGDNEVGNWNEIVEAYRSDELEPSINWIIEILKTQTMWDIAERPQSYEWAFPSLKVPNEEEWTKIKHLTAQTDRLYADMGAVDPKYLYELRYGSGEFRPDISVDEKILKAWNDEDSTVLPENADMVIGNNDSIDSGDIKGKLFEKIINVLGEGNK
jgi:phage-related protein (TIGR01555 family)